ncbi:MAG: prolipoprotein diacylglyceryl transferase, partial [Candidatus Omnitrophota bacterium]|nr:prolipoprotein diacylglyceryl transferase [Candidatus Omnitrophota bacterium]
IFFFDLKGFLEYPVSIFKVWQGGLAIHGGIFGGIIAGIIFSRVRRISFWGMADLLSPSIILGQAIGRIGCFLNGCCFGINNQPTQIYELILDFIGFLLLWDLRKKIRFEGGLFLLYLMTYSVIRIIVSQFRADNLYLWNTGITLADLSSLIIFIIAMVLFIRKRHV